MASQHEAKVDQQKLPQMRLSLSDVVQYLKHQGYSIEHNFVSYYSSVFSAYINCNTDPISKSIYISEDDLEMIDNQLSLRLKIQKGLVRQYQDDDTDDDLLRSLQSYEEEEDDEENKDSNSFEQDRDTKKHRRLPQHYMDE